MPTTALTQAARDLLARPCHAVMASVRPDGQPVSVPTWYLLEEDGRILLNMDAGRRRVAYLRADPRVSLSALKDEDWYTHVSLQGRITAWRDDPDLADIDRLARHYTGREYANRQRPRVSALVAIDRWHGWGELAQ